MEWNVDELAQFLGPAYGEVSPDGQDHFKVVATKIGEMIAVEAEPAGVRPCHGDAAGRS